MTDFWLGFVVGFLAAGLFGLVMRWFRLRQAEWQAMDKPQKVTLETKKTPRQVVLAGVRSGFLLLLAILVLGLLAYAVFRFS